MSATRWLLAMIAEDEDPNVVASAIDSIELHLGREHIGVMEATRDRFPNDPFLGFVIDKALARLNADGGS
jgi:hypothetical protein